MENTDWQSATEIAVEELPTPITTYLVAHRTRDLDAALSFYDAASTVTDEGHTYTGPDAIRAWMAKAASQYTYTTELVAAARVDDQHYDAVHHLEGDFPGGVVDLHFRFTLRGPATIADLRIEG